ncbi:hypothetical protein DES52_101116 [Deinococcus yavapaiensis KR-236]|uniref:Uncharacterized protein n=1 Tax=Deinococcus yavapaiensis KR-236 TaxID=694435 RepID=A0A318SN49_9DEIO|nr:hypothetical protein DES52_101116 [Deinococcus yavapaiensis KR-236]
MILVAFSPSVAWLATQRLDAVSASGQLDAPQLPPPSALTLDVTRDYVKFAARYERVLNDSKVSSRRRVRLLEAHFDVYRHAHDLFGAAQASATMRLLEVETRNQTPALGRRSAFSSPEAALADASRWLAFAHFTLHEAPRSDSERLARAMTAHSPVPMAPDVVFENARWIQRAANATRFPAAVLAAIVDTEQGGDTVAYGLSGTLRKAADTIALRTSQIYGSSGVSGEVSQTVGLTQMSWQDALGQEARLSALGVTLGVPFPQNEADARSLLMRPYANLVLSASRLIGYMNYVAGIGPNSAVPHEDAWLYFLAPGWHNNPALASSGQTWPYAWNAFFKACLYQRLLDTRRMTALGLL